MLLSMMMTSVRARFSGAAQLSTAELAELMMAADSTKRLILLDTRREDEYAVSHLRGAHHLDPETEKEQLVRSALQIVLERMKSEPSCGPEAVWDVVCYCSVGWRSSRTVEAIQQPLLQACGAEQGRLRVWNLEGSCFKWANEGRPGLVRVDEDGCEHSVEYAHPFDKKFGLMLEKNLWKFPGNQEQEPSS